MTNKNLLKIYHNINNIKYTGISQNDDELIKYKDEDIINTILLYGSDIQFMVLIREYLIITNNIKILDKFKEDFNIICVNKNIKNLSSVLKYKRCVDYKSLNVKRSTMIYALENIYNKIIDDDIISMIMSGIFYKSYEIICEIFTNQKIIKRFNIETSGETYTIITKTIFDNELYTQDEKLKIIRSIW